MIPHFLFMVLLLSFSFGLGYLPLSRWIFRAITGWDLTQIGTGQVSVAAAFVFGGKRAGIPVALVEMSRGILPVLVARVGLQSIGEPAAIWEVIVLILLVLGRYWGSRGGGVTNVTWGLIVYAPHVSLAVGLTGLSFWGITRSRLLAARLGALSTIVWVGILQRSGLETLAMLALVAVVVGINLVQADDMTVARQKNLLTLQDPLDPEVFGDKAARLSELQQAGFPVPEGWVLRPEPLAIKRLVARLQPQLSPDQVWIIRSSVLGEDSDTSSAAGQYLTVANVTSVIELEEAIAACQDSLQTPQAIAYRQQRQLADQGMAIVIQRQITGQVSGVAFSRNPLDGGSYRVIEALPGGAQAVVSGAQTPLHVEIPIDPKPDSASDPDPESSTPSSPNQSDVSVPDPSVTSGSSVTSRSSGSSVTSVTSGSQDSGSGDSPLDPNAHPVETSDPSPAASSPNNVTLAPINSVNSVDHFLTETGLPATVFDQLVQVIDRIEAHFHGIPQDIEWSWDGEKLWILQSRPITNLHPIWTRTIAAEVIPGPIPPLTWSINRPLTCGVWGEIFTLVLGDAVKDLDFTQTATLLGSHAYFNATLLGAIFRQMGLPEQGLEFLLRQQKMGKPPRSAYKQLLACLPGLWALIQRERSLPQDFQRDQRDHFWPALQVLDRNPPTELDTVELLSLIDQLQDLLKRCTFYNIVGPIGFAIRRALFRVPDEWIKDETSPEILALRELQQLADQVQQMLASELGSDPKLAQDLDQASLQNPDPAIDPASQVTEVTSKDQEQTSDLTPDLSIDQRRQRIAEILDRDEFQTTFQQILNRYGFLSEVGTDISVPCWRDQPDRIRDLVIGMALQSRTKSSAGSKIKLNLGQRWRADQCQTRLNLKGKIATVYAQLLAYLRWSFQVLEHRWIESGYLQRQNDIFFLEMDQIQELDQMIRSVRAGGERSDLNGLITDLTLTIAERRARFARDRQRQVPTVVYGSLLPETEAKREILTTDRILKGIPASVGIAEGRIKRVQSFSFSDPSDPAELATAVIVVPYTDAGWAPLLIGAKAIVAEVGGQLSHGAIVAREYGIPAVMNVDQALSRLQEGQRVRVDGYRGIVEILRDD